MWLLDLVTTAGSFVLLGIGAVLLSRSGPIAAPSSGAHWIGMAIVLFVSARLLHLPPIENSFDAVALGSNFLGKWYNVPYFLTISSTTLALVYCVPATAWVVGYRFNPAAPHCMAAFSLVALTSSFATSDLRSRPIGYLPDAFEWSVSQVVFWAYVAATIAIVGVAAIALIGRTLAEFAGAIRTMMILIGLAALTAIAFSGHIVLRVFVVHAAPGLFPADYVRNSSLIAVGLTTVVTVLLVAALLVPQFVKLRDRLRRYQLLIERSDDWLRSRRVDHRNLFGDIDVPVTRAECWRAAATPVVTHRMMFEIAER